jgi:hypothetical protein
MCSVDTGHTLTRAEQDVRDEERTEPGLKPLTSPTIPAPVRVFGRCRCGVYTHRRGSRGGGGRWGGDDTVAASRAARDPGAGVMAAAPRELNELELIGVIDVELVGIEITELAGDPWQMSTNQLSQITLLKQQLAQVPLDTEHVRQDRGRVHRDRDPGEDHSARGGRVGELEDSE